MSESRGLVEDSTGRLWSLGPCLRPALPGRRGLDRGRKQRPVGQQPAARPDPSRHGLGEHLAEIIRTDGAYRFARDYSQFPELNTQSDIFGTVAAAPDGIAWLGSTQGLFRLDANAGTYQYFAALGGISTIGASPLASRRTAGSGSTSSILTAAGRTAWRGSTASRRGSIPRRATAARSGAGCRTPRSPTSRCGSSPAATSSG